MFGIPEPGDGIRGFIGRVRHRTDLTGRRIPGGGRIPRHGKVHPMSEPRTRWISKGGAGAPVEPGVRVPEDRRRFIPHRSAMREGSDVDVAVPMGGEARPRFPGLSAVIFDRDPRSPGPGVACRDAGPERHAARGEAVEGGPGPRGFGRSLYVPASGRPAEAPGGTSTGPARIP